MKQGGDRRVRTVSRSSASRSAGFTIVETLIVLAVTAVMFAVVAVEISGRQNKTEFQTAINSFKQQLQQTINETASGFSASTKIQCSAGTPPTLTTGGGPASLGSQGECIFLGKVLQLGIGSVPDDSGLHAFPVVGNRTTVAGDIRPVKSLAEAYPSALSPDQGGDDSQLESGLWLDANLMTYIDASGSHFTHGVGFISNLSGISLDVHGQASGGSSQELKLYAVANSGATNDTTNMEHDIDATAANPTGGLVQAKQVIICLNSGGTQQSAQYTIGNNSDPLAISMQVFYHQGCV